MSNTLPTKHDENEDAIFYTSPRSLLELASIRLALHIWLEKFSEIHQQKRNIQIQLTALHFDTEFSVEIPIAVRKTIESWFHPIAIELDTWFKSSKNVLHHLNTDHVYDRFNLVVFGGSGTVHFKNTIANFLQDDSLNDITRFEMACVYCVEEKIDILWPLVCDSLCVDDMNFYENFMMYYWICRKRGELFRLPLRGFNTIEHLMIDKSSWHYIWLAVEYFLTLLEPRDRLNVINYLFRSPASSICVTYLLPYFEASVQRHVLKLWGTCVLAGFIEYRKFFHYAIQSWLYIRNFITREQFYDKVFRKFLRVRIKKRYSNKNVYDYEYVEIVLTEIWSSSPHHLKEFVLNFHIHDVLREMPIFRGDVTKNLRRDISFLSAVLSDVVIELRKTFWLENWSKWVVGLSSARLNELMVLCLESDEAIDDFKKTLKESDFFTKYCDTLVTRRYNEELDDFLNCVCSNEQEVLDTKMMLLTTNDHWNKCIYKSQNVEQIREWAEFADKLLSKDNLAENFKNQFVLAENNLEILYDKVERNRFYDIEIIVDNFISSEKRSELKEKLFNRFRNRVTKGELHELNESNFENFLIWCVDDDQQRIRNFVKSLPIENIFEVAFSNCMGFDPHEKFGLAGCVKKCTFEDLNKFLRWYFKSTGLCENFIRERVEYYEGMLEAEVEGIFSVDKDSVIEGMKKLFLFWKLVELFNCKLGKGCTLLSSFENFLLESR